MMRPVGRIAGVIRTLRISSFSRPGGSLRVALTRGQVQAYVERAVSLVSAGRPPCPLCGRPIDPDGHMCIKTNGHKKH